MSWIESLRCRQVLWILATPFRLRSFLFSSNVPTQRRALKRQRELSQNIYHMILIFTGLIRLGPLGSMAVQVYFAVSNKLARVQID